MVQVNFKNNYEVQGQRYAQTLKRIIEGAVSEGVAGLMSLESNETESPFGN